MTVHKLSISMPPEVEEIIKAAAAQDGKSVSAWVTEAATEKAKADARHAEALAAAEELMAESEREHGPVPEETRHRNREFLRELGLREDEEWRTAG